MNVFLSIALFIQGLAAGAIRSGTSILYAALGEVIVERAGIVNLGLEGCMLMGAAFGFIATVQSGNAYVGLLAAAIAGGLFNLVLGFLVVTRRASQLASGLVLLFLATGLTALVGASYVGQRINGLDQFSIPLLVQIPWFGPVLFEGDVLTFGIVPCSLVVWWALYRTRWGLWLRTVGESRRVAYATGLNPRWVQYQALAIGGMLGGLGGAQLSLSYAHAWIENMTAGRGFIAVALVIFASWQPLRVILGALLFGGAIAFQLQLQARNAPVSPFLLNMIPYLLTLLVLLALGRKRRYQMPEGLKEVFEGTQTS
ncbi:MAG: ABC transporter permease [Chloroflexi bacterium]|nr:MAG: ABC transporter permease [Chloroflexota bacterium]